MIREREDAPAQFLVRQLKLGGRRSTDHTDALAGELGPVGQSLELNGEMVDDVLVGAAKVELQVRVVSVVWRRWCVAEFSPGSKTCQTSSSGFNNRRRALETHANSLRHFLILMSLSTRSRLQPSSSGMPSD